MSYCVIVLLEHAALVEFMAEAPCKKHITFGIIAQLTLHPWRSSLLPIPQQLKHVEGLQEPDG